MDTLAQNSLTDDSRRVRLTAIGPKEARHQVLDDWQHHPAFAPFREQVLIQAYAPDDPMVSRFGFVTSGKPTIYLQAADGKVQHRQDDYRGPEQLAEAVAQAVRKADPSYDRAKDPDLTKPISLGTVPPELLVPAGLAGVLGLVIVAALLQRSLSWL
jgi:hypothetical protein